MWEGKGVVKAARKLIGATNPLEAEPGTIRGDLAVQTGRNVVHGSDSPENGEREAGEALHVPFWRRLPVRHAAEACVRAGLWFGDLSLQQWQPSIQPWLYE